ncbi:MAG: porin family protein [Candidatus Aminicenantales bacterium]
MKRTVAALALFIGLIPAPAVSQSSIISQVAGDTVASEKLYFGLKFGLNFAYLTGAEAGAERTGGFNGGLSATIRLTDRLSLVPEITLFSRKGIATIPFLSTGDPALDPFFADLQSSELALSYTDIPVLVTYRLGGRIHLGAGPYVGFLSSAVERFQAELQLEGDPRATELSFKREVADRYKTTDFGLVAEASWTITKPRRGMGLVFHIRYQGGLTNVLREYSGPLAVLPPGPYRNSVIQAYMSFPFVH